MLSVTQLARKYGISRATVLYYEREGLLLPKARAANGYRWYSDQEEKRLEMIISYRSSGMPVAQILNLLDHNEASSQFHILKNHLYEIGNEMERLKKQQKAIVAFLQNPELLEKNMVTKERWVEIMKAAGFDESAMAAWHKKFEEMEPEEHQRFLETLGIDADEIRKIRSLSLAK
ncbi:MerR family transcriptional regulator [Gallaecimonas sp. GXIMD1310]|uniref:MerR family transcriptional regulator n=1 Tax=Gallaecimonas sp. GXIMD1310 TaxID=3131926 RepID=UPI00324B3EC5